MPDDGKAEREFQDILITSKMVPEAENKRDLVEKLLKPGDSCCESCDEGETCEGEK